MLRELLLPGGGLASAQDADTDGVEGLTYTWTPDELRGARPRPALPRAVRARPLDHPRRRSTRSRARAPARGPRSERPQPFRDDKVITSWNGLALAAIAEAGRRLERADWLDGGRRARDVPARTAARRRRHAPPQLARRADERPGIPRRLREPRARPARAPRRDRRSVRWLHEAHRLATRGARALRRRGATAASSSRRRTTAQRLADAVEGPPRRPDARRGTRCSPPCSSGSVGSGATRRSSERGAARCGSSCRRSDRAPRAFSWALCALDLHLAAAAGARDRRGRRTRELARAALAPFAARHRGRRRA